MTDIPPTHFGEQLSELVALFGDVATGELLAPLLFLVGAALVGGSVAFVGYLAAGAAVDSVTPS
ncbi:hypothetical protein [Halovivax cerinus]|uniref:Uncharacterized protein n=1 Tax=Halovivax cerinus TaxID=1487865 RepID=A0ABD5NTU3_9EURY|nr:hypothetical protein [Halovivax cerinus]